MRDTVGLTLLDQGKDPANFTDDDFDAAIDRLQKAKDTGQLRGFTGNEYAKALASGDIAACMAWTGDVVQLQADNPNLGYVLPAHGSHALVGQLADPEQGAAQEERRDAHQLLLRPEVMAAVEDYVNYISPVEGAKEALRQDGPGRRRTTR